MKNKTFMKNKGGLSGTFARRQDGSLHRRLQRGGS